MTTREALAALSERGVRLTIWQLRGMLDRGQVAKPRLNSSLAWDWTPADVAAVERVVKASRQQEAAAV